MLEEGFVCGALCGGGNVTWSEKFGNYCISIKSKNKEFIDMFFLSLSNITSKPKKYSLGDTYIVCLYGKEEVGNFLEKWKNRFGVYKWSVPKIAYKDPTFRRGFLCGFFEAGSRIRVRFRGKVKIRSIRTVSINLNGLKEVKNLLLKEGIDPLIYRTGKYWCLEIEGKRRTSMFYRKIGYVTKRKRKMLREAIR